MKIKLLIIPMKNLKKLYNSVKHSFPVSIEDKNIIPTLCLYTGNDDVVGVVAYAYLKNNTNPDKIMELTDEIIKEKKLTSIMVTHNLRYAVEYGNRLIMMHEGNIIIDKSGIDKENIKIDDLLDKFAQISVELGN